MKEITLQDSKKIKLFKRFESKYLVEDSQINLILDYLQYLNYFIVKDNNLSIFDYYSLYFDNDNLDTVKAHEKDNNIRQKLRIREYQNGDKFLEIKEKNNHKSIKTRIPVTSYELNNEKNWVDESFIYDTKTLTKTLEVRYKRMTFINKSKSHRVTLDFDITCHNYITNKDYKLDNYTVIEIKKNKEENVKLEDYLVNNLLVNKTKFSKYYNGMLKTQ